jgi:hypothetical protein
MGVADEHVEPIRVLPYRSQRRDSLRLGRGLSRTLSVGLDELTEANARRSVAAKPAERSPGRIVHRYSSEAGARRR